MLYHVQNKLLLILKLYACIPYLQPDMSAEMIGGISFEESQASLKRKQLSLHKKESHLVYQHVGSPLPHCCSCYLGLFGSSCIFQSQWANSTAWIRQMIRSKTAGRHLKMQDRLSNSSCVAQRRQCLYLLPAIGN